MDHSNIYEIAFNAKSGKYGDEDLFTDLFAWSLRQDQILTNHLIMYLSDFTPSAINKIVTQPSFEGFSSDYPDMLIETPQVNIICEHKIGAPLGNRQLERYLAVVLAEEQRTKKPHRLAFIARDIVNIPTEVLQNPYYRKPAGQTHFRWRDIYALTQSLNELQPISPFYARRTHLLDCMRFLKLAFLIPKGGYTLIATSNTQPDVGLSHFKTVEPKTSSQVSIKENVFSSDKFIQEKAFGEAWLTIDGTESWFEARGYKMEIGSRKELYISACDLSELTPEMGLKHIHLTPNDGKNLPGHASFKPPCLKCFVSFTRDSGNVISQMLRRSPDMLETLSLPLAVKEGKKPTDSFQFWLPLTPILDAADLSNTLRDISVELYQKVIFPAFTKK